MRVSAEALRSTGDVAEEALGAALPVVAGLLMLREGFGTGAVPATPPPTSQLLPRLSLRAAPAAAAAPLLLLPPPPPPPPDA